MAYDYLPTDAYYAMDEETREARCRGSNRQYEILCKEQRQLDMKDELSRREKRDYGSEILSYMVESQAKTLPDVDSMDCQEEIEWYMRPFLVDFLVEAHNAFCLLPETLFLTINILDRYCSKRVVYRKHYQLVGCTALLIASKYGECSKAVPHIKELAKMCCNLYDEEMFTQMERHVMQTLDWSIGASTVDGFLRMVLDDAQDAAAGYQMSEPLDDGFYSSEVEDMAFYISEVAMFDRAFVSKVPSEIAKASLALSRMVLNHYHSRQFCWTANYDQQLVVALSHAVRRPSEVLALKYSKRNKSLVSITLANFINKHLAVAAINPSAPLPTTYEAPASTVPSHSMDVCPPCTPQKSHLNSVMLHGCPTPPITPDSEYFSATHGQMGVKNFAAPPPPVFQQLPSQHQYYNAYSEYVA